MNSAELEKTLLAILDGTDNPVQEAAWLAERASGIPAGELKIRQEPLSPEITERAESMALRRKNGEPLQYILGDEYFGDLLLEVGPGVLIPRPETVFLAELVLSRLSPGGSCCELGTGSGAVSLMIGSKRPDARLFASEISPEAMQYALRNRKKLSVNNLDIRIGSLFDPFPGMSFECVAANLPYIPAEKKKLLQREVRDFEPETALFVPGDGTSLIREALLKLKAHLQPGGYGFFEHGSEQAETLKTFAENTGLFQKTAILADQFGKDRFLMVQRKQ